MNKNKYKYTLLMILTAITFYMTVFLILKNVCPTIAVSSWEYKTKNFEFSTAKVFGGKKHQESMPSVCQSVYSNIYADTF